MVAAVAARVPVFLALLCGCAHSGTSALQSQTQSQTAAGEQRFQEALRLLDARHRTPETRGAARVGLDDARALLPNRADVHAASAEIYLLEAGYARIDARKACDIAQPFAARALQLDPRSGYAHYAWGGYLLWCRLDLAAAETELARATEL